LRNLQITLLPISLAILLGLAAGLVDLNAREVQPAVLCILVFTGLMGILWPKGAWLWGALIGGGIPLLHGLALAVGYRPPYPVQPNVFATFLALIPAFLGACVGAGVGSLFPRPHNG